MSTDEYRLPRHAVPIRYDLVLEPDLGAATFDGTVAIELSVSTSTPRLRLNAMELDIGAMVLEQNGETIEISSYACDPESETLEIELAGPLAVGSACLSITFSGILNDQLRGFYRSTYTDTEGTEKTIATTQFESTSARYAFPCFDEPELKAVFGVTLVVDQHLTAISCGPEIERRARPDDKVEVVFADTMPMSTYIVAFIVGELEVTEPIEVRGVPVRLVHVPGKAALTGFGLEVAQFAIGWLEDYFDIPIPVDKLDLVAVPDFASGAMENHGCLTFRESLLLADPDGATTSELVRVADVVAHEIAHMWFGNLVTMSWWEGIWLKEAFATFMENATVAAFRPEWNRWDQFARDRGVAFEVDSLASTRPIEFAVHSPADAEAMFDVLTYEKGAAVVRMLEQHLGPEVFRDGVRHYLRKFEGANTNTTDLWDALEESSGQPVRSTMDSWIFQGGHPMIDVQPTDTGIEISQSVFRYEGTADGTWAVPVLMRADLGGSIVDKSVLLTEPTTTVDLGGRPRWVVANAGANGFYRVSYEPSLAAELIEQAEEVMSVAERVSFVDDMVAAVTACRTEPIRLLELIEQFMFETDLSVWRSMAIGLDLLDRLVDAAKDAGAKSRFAERVGRVVGPALDVLGVEPAAGEDGATAELRGLLLRLAGTVAQDARAHSVSRALVQSGVAGADPELHAAAVAVVASNGTDQDFEAFVAEYEGAATPQIQQRYLMALARFPEAGQIQRTMEMCRERVRSQNAPFLLAHCLAHKQHGAMVWQFISQHWDELTARFPSNSVPRMLGGIVHLNDPAVADDVAAFVGAHPIPEGGATIDQHLERMRVQVRLCAEASAGFAAALTAV